MQIAVQSDGGALVVLATGGHDGPGNLKRKPTQTIERREFIDAAAAEQVPRALLAYSLSFQVTRNHASFAAAETHVLQHEQQFHGETFAVFIYHDHDAIPGTDDPDLTDTGCTVTVTAIKMIGEATITTYQIKGGTFDAYEAP